MPSEQHNFTQEHATHRHDCTRAVTQQAIMLHCFDLHPKKRHHCTVKQDAVNCYHFPDTLSQLQLGGNSKQAVD